MSAVYRPGEHGSLCFRDGEREKNAVVRHQSFMCDVHLLTQRDVLLKKSIKYNSLLLLSSTQELQLQGFASIIILYCFIFLLMHKAIYKKILSAFSFRETTQYFF